MPEHRHWHEQGRAKYQILAECENVVSHEGVEITRHIWHNGPGPELVLRFSNDDMEDRDDITADTAYWDKED